MTELMALNCILIAGIVALVILATYIGEHMSTREQFLFLMVILFVITIQLGNLLEYNSRSLDAAMLSRCISCVGACYAEWLLLLFVIRFLDYQKPRLLIYTLFFLHTVILISVLANRYNTLFYGSAVYHHLHGVGRVYASSGPLNYLHRVLMLFYAIAIPCYCFHYYYHHRNTRNGRNAIYLSLCVIFPAIGYIIHMTGITGEFDPTCVFFTGSVIVAFFLNVRGHLFDVVEIARNQLISSLSDAVIILSPELQILYMNDAAHEIFVDVYNNMDTYQLIGGICKNARESYEKEGKTYNIHTDELRKNGQFYGYTLVFSDVTELADYATELKSQVDAKVSEITRIQQKVLMSFANMIELRDDLTGQHVKRTTAFVEILSQELVKRHLFPDELDEFIVARISAAAALHDIGKITISDTILQKPGKLTREEFEVIKTHSSKGGYIIEEILSDVGDDSYLEDARIMALYHHEKWDGTGYPEGLSGTDIPLSARIMAVADVFDALISKRQYKDAFDLDQAFSIIEESAGSHFDPIIAGVFVELRPQIEKLVMEFNQEENNK